MERLDDTTPTHRQPVADAVVALGERHGAHVILCDPDKRPYWGGRRYSWKREHPTPDVILAHPGPFGIVPWSIRSTVIDVDDGEPHQLRLFAPPYVELPTRRGWHEYYDDDRPRVNGSRRQVLGCTCDVRGAAGYCVLHDDGAGLLLSALDDLQRERRPFPAALFDAAPLFTPRMRRRSVGRREVQPARRVEDAVVGQRNETLFASLRRYADRAPRPRRADGGVDVTRWHAVIADRARQTNERLRQPLEGSEVGWVAYSVSTWFASREGHARTDHSPARQAMRGRVSGVRRREAVSDRDRAILQALAEGLGVRHVGRVFRVAAGTVRHVRNRGGQ